MDRTKSLIIKSFIFLVNLGLVILIFLLYFGDIIIAELLLALIFLQSLINGMLLFRYFLYKRFQRLAKELNFEYITGFMEQPRMEGHYRDNWWQLHFVNKESGDDRGILRTYVKLQYKKPKEFDDDVLKEFSQYNVGNQGIIIIKHIERPYKNYLLMKRRWFTFSTKEIHELMDFLLKVADKAMRS